MVAILQAFRHNIFYAKNSQSNRLDLTYKFHWLSSADIIYFVPEKFSQF